MPLVPPLTSAIFPSSLPMYFSLRLPGCPKASETLLERPQVELEGPGGSLLAVDLPKGLRDRVDTEQTILAAFRHDLRPRLAEAVAIDPAVDHDMGDVDALRPVFPRHALRDRPESSFGCREVRVTWLAPEARRGSREDDRASAQWDQPARRLPSDQESREAADAPEILEHLRRELAKIDLLIVAGVEDDEVGRLAAGTGRERPVQEASDVLLARGIGRDGFSAASRRGDGAGDLLYLLTRTASDEHVIALAREAAAERGAEAEFGADADDDCGRRAHHLAPSDAAMRSRSSPLASISRTMSHPPTKAPSI